MSAPASGSSMAPEPAGFRRLNEEVYVADRPVTRVTGREIDFLKQVAATNARHRARLCAHGDVGDALHEMLIVHMGGTYVRPHKHLAKSESFHIVEGRLTVFLFDDDGRLVEAIHMGAPGSGHAFFYRLSTPMFHSVLPESDFVVFHEVTNGPFDRRDTIFAPWAPAEDSAPEEQDRFMRSVLGTAD